MQNRIHDLTLSSTNLLFNNLIGYSVFILMQLIYVVLEHEDSIEYLNFHLSIGRKLIYSWRLWFQFSIGK